MATRLSIGVVCGLLLVGMAHAQRSQQYKPYLQRTTGPSKKQLHEYKERRELLEKQRQRQVARFRGLQRSQLASWRNERGRQILQRAFLRGSRLSRNPQEWRLPKSLRPTHVTSARFRLLGLSRAAFARARPTPDRNTSRAGRSLPGLRQAIF